MNCNKCGTPILPGENTCRFCGASNDFSKRESKLELIGFDYEEKSELVSFMIGEDDLSLNTSDDKVAVTKNEPIIISDDEVVEETTMVENIKSIINPEPVRPIVNSVIDEPKTARIPVEEIKSIIEKEEEIGEPSINLDNTTSLKREELDKAIEPDVKVAEEPKKEKPVNDNKRKKSHGSRMGLIIVSILLIASMILNCFLLMGKAENAPAMNKEEVSDTKAANSFKGYEIELPSNWNIDYSNTDYLLAYDGTKNWAISINYANLEYDLVKDNVDDITTIFGSNKYLFTSDYVKTVNNKEVYIFKGKYDSYATYVVLTKIDDENMAVADLKFTGEVDDNVLNSLLESLVNVYANDNKELLKDNFNFSSLESTLQSVLVEEKEEN